MKYHQKQYLREKANGNSPSPTPNQKSYCLQFATQKHFTKYWKNTNIKIRTLLWGGEVDIGPSNKQNIF